MFIALSIRHHSQAPASLFLNPCGHRGAQLRQARSPAGQALTWSLESFPACLASLACFLSSRVACCSRNPFCFCSANVIHSGCEVSAFSASLEPSRECLLCSTGLSVGETDTVTYSKEHRRWVSPVCGSALLSDEPSGGSRYGDEAAWTTLTEERLPGEPAVR